jgi:hypothetical protein
LAHNFQGRDDSLTLHYDFSGQPDLRARNGVGPTLGITRATTATFLDQDNILRTAASGEARFTGARRVENLVIDSNVQLPGGADWTETSGTLTSNSIDNPIGGEVDAAKLSGNASDTQVRMTQSTTNRFEAVAKTGGTYCYSAYMKAGTNITWSHLTLTSLTGLDARAYFDLENGTLGATLGADNVDAGIIDVGNGWYRCWLAFLIDGTDVAGNFNVYGAEGDNDVSFAVAPPATDFFYAWGTQCEDVSGQLDPSPSEYIPTTTAAVAQTYATERRTNLCLQSNDLSASWTNTRSTDTQNAGPDPFGGNAANKLIMDGTSANNHHILQSVLGRVKDNEVYTFSAYLKAAELDWAALRIKNQSTGGNVGAYFDLANGATGTVDAGVTAEISDVGGGWYRCSITHDILQGAFNGTVFVYLAEANEDITIDGDSTSGIYTYGMQLEQSPYVTPYIPTTTSVASSGWEDIKGVLREDTNICLQSQAAGTTWTLARATQSANVTTAPDGTTTADKIMASTDDNTHKLTQSIAVVAGKTYTFSAYIKAAEEDEIYFDISTVAFPGASTAYFDVGDGTVGTVGAGADSTAIQDAGNGWYRCSITTTADATGANDFGLWTVATGEDNSYIGNASDGIYVWGMQLEAHHEATPYIPTTTAAVSAYRHVTPPGLLVEEARTNSATYSEDWSHANWVKATGVTISANDTAAPNGTVTADFMEETADTNAHQTNQAFTFTAAAYTWSAYVKPVSRQWIRLMMYDGTTFSTAYFDLTNEVVGTFSAGVTGDIEVLPNGWYRIWMSDVQLAAAGGVYINGALADSGVDTYAGEAAKGYNLFGAQLELGAFPTSYIPTTTIAVARNADVVSTTDVSWYNSAASTLYTKASQPVLSSNAENHAVNISDASTSDRHLHWKDATTVAQQFSQSTTGDNSNLVSGVSYVAGVDLLSASALAHNDLEYYVSGTRTGTGDQAVDIPVGVTTLNVGSDQGGANQWNGHIAEIRYYNTRKPNAYLEDLSNGNIDV